MEPDDPELLRPLGSPKRRKIGPETGRKRPPNWSEHDSILLAQAYAEVEKNKKCMIFRLGFSSIN